PVPAPPGRRRSRPRARGPPAAHADAVDGRDRLRLGGEPDGVNGCRRVGVSRQAVCGFRPSLPCPGNTARRIAARFARLLFLAFAAMLAILTWREGYGARSSAPRRSR